MNTFLNQELKKNKKRKLPFKIIPYNKPENKNGDSPLLKPLIYLNEVKNLLDHNT